MRHPTILIAALLVLASPAQAVQPDEILKEPALEARARGITSELRCMVCQNESVDDSNAPLAKDLRLLVRERIVAGDSDGQVKAFLLARYGEFVLLRPLFTARNAVLWLAPFAILVVGGLVVFRNARVRGRREVSPLSADEMAELERVLGKTS